MKDPFIYIPEMGLSLLHENEITTPTEFKVVEFDSTNPGINTDEGFFFFNLKTKHCGEFSYRTWNKKAFVDFGNQLEKNHKGPYRIEVIKDTIYICSTPELYNPAIHGTQDNLISLETMENIETEAKNYAVNRRNENYDAESDIFELENGGILEPAEVEKIIEEVRTEAFVAGAKSIMNLNSDKISNLLQQEIISLNEKIKNLNKKNAELGEELLKEQLKRQEINQKYTKLSFSKN